MSGFLVPIYCFPCLASEPKPDRCDGAIRELRIDELSFNVQMLDIRSIQRLILLVFFQWPRTKSYTTQIPVLPARSAASSCAVAAIFGVLSDLTTRFPILERFALGSPAVKDSGVIEINNSNLTAVIFGLYGWVPCPSRCEFNGSGKSRQLRDWRVSYIRMKYPV